MDIDHAKNNIWRVNRYDEFKGLDLERDSPMERVGSHECMVKIEAASLNFRDLMVAQVQLVLISLCTAD